MSTPLNNAPRRAAGLDHVAAGRRRQPRHAPSLLCLSHLRWDFVFQRPQHLMTRFARHTRVLYMEEPRCEPDVQQPWLDVKRDVAAGVDVLVPRLPAGPAGSDAEQAQRRLIDAFLQEEAIDRLALWYYTPMSLAFTDHLPSELTVYDAMDELSAFRGAPPQLIERERQLMARADVMFTGGYSLYESKRHLHTNVHAFPSSVDVPHFLTAREPLAAPPDQAHLPRPRLGFYGVIDERFDAALLGAVAQARPQWQFVLLGPVAKIDTASLPHLPNIHYLGQKAYAELPAYLAGWDVALMPFALNESTRYISPTKTPEYLAAGRPVVSTPIADVVRTYGSCTGVRIAADAASFIECCEAALQDAAQPRMVADAADRVLAGMSWDATWTRMAGLMGWRPEAMPAHGAVMQA